jgi:4-aminobutyrate aminotransferase
MNNLVHESKNALAKVLGRYHDIAYTHGEGAFLYDTDGKQYIDMSAGLGVCSTGHCHPRIVDAICKQAKTLIHPCIGNGHYEPPVALAQKLNHLASSTISYSTFFSQSGSEANEAAIKLAKYVTKRKKLVAFQGGFHGRTLGSLSLTTSKMKYREGYEPLLAGIDFFPYPYIYRCPWGKDSQEDSIKASIEALESSPLFNSEVAAVIIEPALGEGGYIPAPKAFLQALRKICDHHGILLIVDEVQTGIGRTGTWFAYEHSDIQPDIITLAKGLGSGMPIGACVAKTELMDDWLPGAHGGTFGSNPVTCAAGLATINVIEEVINDIPDKGQYAFNFLRNRLDKHPNVGEIRGYGLFIGIELVKNKNTKEPYPELIRPVLDACRDAGVIIISCGLHDNVIRLMPPLTIDKDTLTVGLQCLCESLNDHN